VLRGGPAQPRSASHRSRDPLAPSEPPTPATALGERPGAARGRGLPRSPPTGSRGERGQQELPRVRDDAYGLLTLGRHRSWPSLLDARAGPSGRASHVLVAEHPANRSLILEHPVLGEPPFLWHLSAPFWFYSEPLMVRGHIFCPGSWSAAAASQVVAPTDPSRSFAGSRSLQRFLAPPRPSPCSKSSQKAA